MNKHMNNEMNQLKKYLLDNLVNEWSTLKLGFKILNEWEIGGMN